MTTIWCREMNIHTIWWWKAAACGSCAGTRHSSCDYFCRWTYRKPWQEFCTRASWSAFADKRKISSDLVDGDAWSGYCGTCRCCGENGQRKHRIIGSCDHKAIIAYPKTVPIGNISNRYRFVIYGVNYFLNSPALTRSIRVWIRPTGLSRSEVEASRLRVSTMYATYLHMLTSQYHSRESSSGVR